MTDPPPRHRGSPMNLEALSAFISSLVRPLAVVILLVGATWGFFEGRISGSEYMVLVTGGVAWLFAERTSSKAHEAGVKAALTVPPGAHLNEPPPPNPPLTPGG